MIESLINNKDDIETCTIPKVFQLQQVWLLQMIKKQTSNITYGHKILASL